MVGYYVYCALQGSVGKSISKVFRRPKVQSAVGLTFWGGKGVSN